MTLALVWLELTTWYRLSKILIMLWCVIGSLIRLSTDKTIRRPCPILVRKRKHIQFINTLLMHSFILHHSTLTIIWQKFIIALWFEFIHIHNQNRSTNRLLVNYSETISRAGLELKYKLKWHHPWILMMITNMPPLISHLPKGLCLVASGGPVMQTYRIINIINIQTSDWSVPNPYQIP